MINTDSLKSYCLRLGDNSLILGHRLSEWCGHGPVLEEDIAMSNMALDLIGQSRGFLSYAAKLEGKGRTEDDLAYLRDAREFVNCMLVEQPNGDFAFTMMRSFLYSVFAYLNFSKLVNSKDEKISGLAEKSLKEIIYHYRHSADWVIRLGDGTTETRWSAVRVGSDNDWTAVAAGQDVTAALKANGSLWIWGGGLGPNPYRVGTDTNWVAVDVAGEFSDSGSEV